MALPAHPPIALENLLKSRGFTKQVIGCLLAKPCDDFSMVVCDDLFDQRGIEPFLLCLKSKALFECPRRRAALSMD